MQINTKFSRYYYSLLNDVQKAVYDHICEQLEIRSESIILNTTLAVEIVTRIYYAVLDDNPYLYHIDRTKLEYSVSAGLTTLYPKYLFTVFEKRDLDEALGQKISSIGIQAARQSETLFDLIKQIHDRVAMNVEYDEDALSVPPERAPYAFSIIGPLLQGKAVCEGFSKSVQILFDHLKIKSVLVRGMADDSYPHLRSQYVAGHAWNIIRLEERCYHLDATWDSSLSRGQDVCYDYFMLDDASIKADHSWTDVLPVCNSMKYNYHNYYGLVVSSYDQFVNHLKASLEKRYITLKLDRYEPTRQQIEDAFTACLRYGSRSRIQYEYTINEKQKIISIRLN